MTEDQKAVLSLIKRSTLYHDSWYRVSPALWIYVTSTLGEEYIEIIHNEDGSGYLRLTDYGKKLMNGIK